MSKLLINEEPLQVLPSLAKAIGLNEAMFLQQVHYWLNKSKHYHDDKVWIYNTYQGWMEQFPFWSERTLKRIVAALREQGLIITTDEYNKIPIDKTLWYTIDYTRLDNLARRECQNGTSRVPSCYDESVNLASPIPENNTENNTENFVASQPSPTPQQEMFGAICEAIGWDYHVISDKNKGQVAQAVKVLNKAGYTVDDIRRFMMDVWFHDWRWEKKQQYPTLSQLREEIGKIRSVVPAAAPAKKTKSMESWERLGEQLRTGL